MVAPVSNCGPSVFDVSPAQGAIAIAEGPGQRLWGPGLRSPRRSKARGQRGALGRAGWGKNCFSDEKVSNCGPSVFDVSPAQGAIAIAEGPGQRLWGPGLRSPRRSKARGQRGALGRAGWGKNCFSGEKGSDSNRGGTKPAIMRSAEPAAIESEGPTGTAGRRGMGAKNFFSGERSSVGSNSNHGGTGPAIVGSAEPVGIVSEGPAGSAWRGGIGKKNCFCGEKGKKKIVQKEKRGATRGLPAGSPFLVLLSPKHA
ncbi:Hypothetical predicted protein [Olea europaea subsp. europaea]|uniref:Uncharacterized protein n=1 Tax=Olea europaea subsp. europaea TaxID=158383 RepID=A0A8S0RQ50_OLEEU|nr:Hypothetical predicted protein [Olea europaea subsp. europaea]